MLIDNTHQRITHQFKRIRPKTWIRIYFLAAKVNNEADGSNNAKMLADREPSNAHLNLNRYSQSSCSLKQAEQKPGGVKRIWLTRIRAYFSSVVAVLVPFSPCIPNTHLHVKCVSTIRLHGNHPSIGGQYSWDLLSARDRRSLETQE